MLYIVKMPKLSPTMEMGTIVKWKKSINEYVNTDEVLLEISTDKSVIEYSFLEEGWLREILTKENEKAVIGSPIAIITSEKDEQINKEEILTSISKNLETTKISLEVQEKQELLPNSEICNITTYSSTSSQIPSFSPEPPLSNTQYSTQIYSETQKISPLAKFISKEKNLDLSDIKGSGPGGWIVEKDLINAPKKNVVKFHQIPLTHNPIPGTYEEKALSPIREVISSRLQAAKISIPHFYIKQEINAQNLINLKNQLNNVNFKFSYNDFITRACAIALKEFPNINSGFNSVNNSIVLFKTIDISFAVALENGLITPIIRYADQKNIQSISLEIKELARKAKNNQLSEHEYKGGSFCISNLGMTNIQEFFAIINPPQ